MADDIRQEFVFDAAQALKTLEMLTSRYEKLNTVLRSHAKTVKSINTSTRKITGNLIQIKNAAKAAADQLQRVYGAKATTATQKATKATSAPPVDKGQVDKAKASLQELDAVARKTFAGAPIKNQKLFNRGLNELVLAFHRSGGSVADFRAKLKLLDTQVNGTQARMRSAMRNIQTATKQATSTDVIRNFTVSWQTMVRIITTQLIVRSLNVLRQALRDAISESLDFTRAVAEVGTIANDAYGGLDNIADIIRKTSDEFGKSRLDVAEGLYQTLSNQVGNATESLKVFRTANKLSIAAVGSTEDAVNLLTAALNGFDISTSQSELVAAKLFKTVELGRTRMSELANTMGRVGPLANALGISLDETLAAIATITVQGTKSAEALTQLRGVMQGMIKPSEDMKKIFTEIGVANAEAGIATFGFQGFLDEMTKITGKSTSEMGKLIRRVRGLLGAVTLASEDTKKFIENLEEIENVSSQLLTKKYKIVFETPGEEFRRQLNELKNILVVDIGTALVEVANNALKFGRAFASALPSLKAMGLLLAVALLPRLKLMLFSLQAYGTALALVITKHTLFLAHSIATLTPQIGLWRALTTTVGFYNVALAGATLGLSLLAASVVGAIYYFDQQEKAAEKSAKALVKLAEAQSEYQKSLDLKEIELFTDLEKRWADTQSREALRILAISQKSYNSRIASAQAADKEEQASAKDKFNSMSKLLDQYVADYKKEIDNLGKLREDSEHRVDGIVRSAEQARFDRSTRFLGAQQKLDAQRARGLKLQREASKYLITGDPDKIQRGLALYREAGKIFDDIRDIAYDQLEPLETAWRAGKLSADQFNNLQKARRADNAANQLGVNLSNAQLKAERALQQVLDARAAKAKADVEYQKQLNAKLKTQFDIVLDNMKTLDDSGRILDEKVLKDQAKSREMAFARIRELASETLGGLDLADQLQLASLKADIESAFSPTTIALNEEALNTASDRVRQAFLTGMDTATREWATSLDLARTLVPGFDPSEGFGEAQAAVAKMVKDYRDLVDKAGEVEQKQAEIRKAVTDTTAQQKNLLDTMVVPSFFTDTYVDTAGSISQMLNQLRGARSVSVEMVQSGKQLVQTFRDMGLELAKGSGPRGKILAFADMADNILESTQNVGVLKAELAALEKQHIGLGGFERQAALAKILEDGAMQRTEHLNRNRDAIQKALGITNTYVIADQKLTESTRKRRDYLQDINRINAAQGRIGKTAQAQTEAIRLRTQGFMKGGLVKSLMYLAKGNLARGTDTIPAMLSPGEFVMNAKSTRRFYSQLVAMNSGQKPIYRQEGGPVTNVRVGDVHVQGGKNPAQTGRQIVGAIKRELRRGTSSF